MKKFLNLFLTFSLVAQPAFAATDVGDRVVLGKFTATAGGLNLSAGTASNTNRIVLPKETTSNLAGLTNTAGSIAYDTTLNKPVYNNGTTWNAVGSGAGAGTNSQREYISNGTAETNTTGWAVYADAAGTSPVDGTGGSANVVFSRTTSSSEVIRETASFKLAKDAANRQGQGFSYDFTIDPQDYKNSRAVFVTADYQVTSNYADDYVVAYVYDKDAGSLISCRGFTGEATGPFKKPTTASLQSKFACVFYPTNATSDDYRLIGHIATTTTTAWDFMIDSVHTGPDVLAPGVFGTAVESWTPTGTWVSNATYVGKKWRDKDKGCYKVTVTTSGAPTNTQLNINMPSGEVIDTNKMSGTANNPPLGFGTATDTGVVNNTLVVSYSSTSAVTISSIGSGSTYTNLAGLNHTVPFTFGNTDTVDVQWCAHIVGWAATNMLSTTEVNLQNPANAPLTATSSQKTPGGSGHYHALTGNSVVLTPGVWVIKGVCQFSNSAAVGYTGVGCGLYGSNGADSSSAPTTNLSSVVTILDPVVTNSFGYFQDGINSASSVFANMPPTKVRCVTSTCTVYMDTYAAMATPTNARITTFISADKQADFSVFGVYPTAPTISTVTRTTNSGGFSAAASGTYTPPAGVRYLKVIMVGGGGGGGSSGTASGNAGSAGGATTFGTSLLTAAPGAGGSQTAGNSGGTGGTFTVNSPANDCGSVDGGSGGGNSNNVGYTNGYAWAGIGGSNPLGGGGGNGPANGNNTTSGNARTNTGGGGGGASTNGTASNNAGSGGGAGGYVCALINNPSGTYAYAVGAGGAGGTGGTNGFTGGSGAGGRIVVEEYY